MHILGDWGTSRLRLWRIEQGKAVERIDGPGIGVLSGSPTDALIDLIAPWKPDKPTSITLCGMAGAKNGLTEVPYAECVTTSHTWARMAVETDIGSLSVRIAAGVASGHDVMRGEETQVFGALRLRPELAQASCVFVLPGTHSKWVQVERGAITGLRTFLTGELYALLGKSSLFATGAEGKPGEDVAGFADGLAQGHARPGLLGSLFRARVGQLREGFSHDWAQGFVSGLLIANECTEMAQEALLSASIFLIGDPRLAVRYEQVLAGFGVATQTLDPDACVLAGLEMLDAFD